jgi:hypothetical protein
MTKQEMAALCITTYNQRGWINFAGANQILAGEQLLETAAELLND